MLAVPSGSTCALAVFTSQILTHPSMDAVTAQEDDPAGNWQDVAEAPEKYEHFIHMRRTLAQLHVRCCPSLDKACPLPKSHMMTSPFSAADIAMAPSGEQLTDTTGEV